jgi:uncharacterized membrane protein
MLWGKDDSSLLAFEISYDGSRVADIGLHWQSGVFQKIGVLSTENVTIRLVEEEQLQRLEVEYGICAKIVITVS